jgi:hypothetical protein
MSRIQWKDVSSGLFGLDTTAIPTWLMVSYRSWRYIDLENAANKKVESVNRGVAEINETGTSLGANLRSFSIFGRMPGKARIEVRDSKTKALESTLEVSVKKNRQFTISFFLVEDRAGNKLQNMRYQLEDFEYLISDLNGIFKPQTKVRFALGRSLEEIKLKTHLGDVVLEEKDKTGSPTGDGIIVGKQIWREIIRKNADKFADFNVFFVPPDGHWQNNRNDIVFIDGYNCVIEEGNIRTDWVLAQAIGRMFGCPFHNNAHNELMFFAPGYVRTDNFIPRDAANIINR